MCPHSVFVTGGEILLQELQQQERQLPLAVTRQLLQHEPVRAAAVLHNRPADILIYTSFSVFAVIEVEKLLKIRIVE